MYQVSLVFNPPILLATQESDLQLSIVEDGTVIQKF